MGSTPSLLTTLWRTSRPDASGHPSAHVDSSQPSWGGKGTDDVVQGGEDKKSASVPYPPSSPTPRQGNPRKEEVREIRLFPKRTQQGFELCVVASWRPQEMLRARIWRPTAGGTDFPGAETHLPRGGQKHAMEEISSPGGSGLRKGKNSGNRRRNGAVSVSWGPPCLPRATPSRLLCFVASLLLVFPSSPSSVCIPTPFFFFSSSSCLQSQKTSLRPANRRLPVLNHFVSSGLIFFQN